MFRRTRRSQGRRDPAAAGRLGPGGGGIGRPRSLASSGTEPAARRAARRRSSLAEVGSPAGLTFRLTGDSTTAPKSSDQRSSGTSGDIAAPAAEERRTASAPGRRALGSGGLDEIRTASATRSSSSAALIRPSHASRRAVTRESRDSRRAVNKPRASSSSVTADAPATMERTSRRGASRPAPRTATALSFQEASVIVGSNCSAMESRGSGDISARSSARARAFCSSIARRTAGIPPRSNCSATGSCSGRNSASAAFRCVAAASSFRLSRLSFVSSRGRGARLGLARSLSGLAPRCCEESAASLLSSGRALRGLSRWGPVRPRSAGRSRSALVRPRSAGRSRSALEDPASPSERCLGARRRGVSGRLLPSGRDRGSSSRRRLDPGAITTETPLAASRPEPSTSMRVPFSASPRESLTACTAVTKMPSSSKSASALKTSPTAAPDGSRVPSTEPRGWRAPGARQVHDPSSRRLVSSMSIFRDMAGDHATRVQAQPRISSALSPRSETFEGLIALGSAASRERP